MLHRTALIHCLLLAFIFCPAGASAQPEEGALPPSTLDSDDLGGEDLANKLTAIFDAIPGLENVNVQVELGVVNLSGTVPDSERAVAAQEVAKRFQGVVQVVGEPEVQAEVADRVVPMLERLRELWDQFRQSLPIIAVAFGVVVIFWVLSSLVRHASRLFAGFSGNVMLRELLARSVSWLVLLVGIFLALDLLNLTGVVGALAGAAGVIGIALGFATRDMVENYLASILLSAHSPFSVKDWVQVGDQSGSVVRMTSRELVLMSMEGNHIRIPNAEVFKSTIINFTRNPLRAFSFEVGLGTEEELEDARAVGLAALNTMPGVLPEPPPVMHTLELGESSVIVRFMGWVNQNENDFLKVQSEAIRIVKVAFDEENIEMPAPIHIVNMRDVTGEPEKPVEKPRKSRVERTLRAEAAKADVSRETHLEQQIEMDQELAADEENLLEDKP